ncbi:Anaerobic sulfatase-maturating enzyme [Providencia rustigianii]|uniref:Anaerobic sulfatase maturase n=2 Tax=Providencia rustigianii TaxID=158850 RepID=D1P6M5_9GAMM|nr:MULTISPECIES: anaerobic sulfatase maturase [Providencia]EFB70947.1 anaerobic sulfatase maturase [Providencia rustigianii DSM 4541]MTC58016.1 anaerobic sulfatase maturase [Providencia rustigianii]MTC60233.1 anaerobic sulfatase maturase [Providencia rustigianii]SPY76565.1 Anaerobic sulfatase-maturating enzyme [Providencia rustigianii]SUC34523.1 Anaerobic sulfatase-maturating enzyme [Providencia rustigianii]
MSSKQPAYFHMMAKPTSYHCNIKCEYCFYLEKENVFNEETQNGQHDVMPDNVLRRYIKDYIQSNAGDQVDFSWQGGEPTLAGLPFFERVVEYQKQYAQGKTITNSVQTNAIAINRQWAQFFADNHFLLGVSIDGLEAVHDKYRISVNGNPTFERVKKSIQLLIEYGVEFNTLTVVNDQNWRKGKETYQALKALGSTFFQFIPIVEVDRRFPHTQGGHYAPGPNAVMAPFSVPSDGYGQFMADVFDEWIRQGDVGKIYVRLFDSLLGTWMGYPASTCIQSKTCGQALIIEANGDVYSCDHYVYPANRLGNVNQNTLARIVTSKQQLRFGQNKYDKLTNLCKKCEVQSLCYGGCPKHRIISIEGEKYRHNYLCSSYKKIFNHTALGMRLMQQAITQGAIASDALPAMQRAYKQ